METRHPSFAEALRFWLKLGLISFGGPAGQIAIMQAELVERRRWIGRERFLHALNFCMLLPGPEATQLAIYIGWLLHRVPGGLVAGILFVLPSALLLWGLSWVYVAYGALPWIAALFEGLKPAVIAIVISALLRLGTKALRSPFQWGVALAAFIGIDVLRWPFPLILALAAFAGWAQQRWAPVPMPSGAADAPLERFVLEDFHTAAAHTHPSLKRSIRVAAIGTLLWWLPTLGFGAWLGIQSTLFQQGLFFGKAALVTFGGAYAVLPYVAQRAVEGFHWLTPSQMLDGLGLAETTPGPLIMVLQFVGFLGAWNAPGALPPLVAATLGAFVTTWATFAPCFLWIFLGAPSMERLRGERRLNAVLSSISAAVVGVILNLAVWFAGHVLHPTPGAINGFALLVSAIALFGMLRWKWGILPVIAGSALAGLIRYALFS